MRLGLFGGTFNPIHHGHLRAGLEIQERFSLDRVLYLPAAIPPHKASRELLSFAHRLKMVRLAVEGQSRLKASDAEIKRRGKSYSIQTVRYFHRAFPKGVELFFILGLDAFLEISTWREYRQLFELCHFIVLDRQGVSRRRLPEFLLREISPEFVPFPREHRFHHPAGYSVHWAPITRLDISSTTIRGLRRQEKSVAYLVPGAVEEYILKKRLYGNQEKTTK
jgi:nicotinate-nucleotide adenylyltransferase